MPSWAGWEAAGGPRPVRTRRSERGGCGEGWDSASGRDGTRSASAGLPLVEALASRNRYGDGATRRTDEG